MNVTTQLGIVPRVSLALFSLAMGGFAIGTAEFAAMSVLPFFSVAFEIDEPTAGHAISAYALGVVVGAPLIAIAGARVKRRRLLIGLMAIYAIGNASSAIAPNFPLFVISRFFSGIPHGAYFGVAALVAASLVPFDRRSQAVSRVMLGLTVATIFGVPFATALGLSAAWRLTFAIVVALALLTAILVFVYTPDTPPNDQASMKSELSALGRIQVWLTLGIGAIGSAGLFAIYTYLSVTLTEVTRLPTFMIPIIFSVFGIGMTIGTLVIAKAGDRALMPTIGSCLFANAVTMAILPLAAGNAWSMTALIFLIGCGGGLVSIIQTRLMDVAKEAQTLAATLNHSAFNVANALGPWLAGLAIDSGWGWTSSGLVGSAMALLGLCIWIISWVQKIT